VLDGFATMSVDVAGHTPADFAVQIKKDTDRWAPIVKESGFTPLD
jgi:tripartite-type tricarboxylate transporter receptor subunit TctC